MNVLRLNPMRDLDSWFNHVDSNPSSGRGQLPSWKPRVDILEEKEHFFIRAELAGIPKDAINVQVEKNILTLSGERKAEFENEKQHRIERRFGRFSRSFTLPESVDLEAITAESKDGVLTLTLPKQEPEKTLKRVEIH